MNKKLFVIFCIGFAILGFLFFLFYVKILFAGLQFFIDKPNCEIRNGIIISLYIMGSAERILNLIYLPFSAVLAGIATFLFATKSNIRRWLTFILVLAILFGSGVSLSYYQSHAKCKNPKIINGANPLDVFKSASPIATNTMLSPSPSQSITWRHYENTKLGFTIDYPSTWKIDTWQTTADHINFTAGSNGEGLESIGISPKNMSLDEWKNAFKPEYIQSVSEMVVGGEPAIKIVSLPQAGQIDIGVKHNGTLFFISTDGKMLENGMIDSFKFLDRED